MPHAVFLIGEDEYETERTLPIFANKQLQPRGIRCTMIHADPKDENNFPGLVALKTADLLFVSVRRRALSANQMLLVKEYLEQGKPLIGIRTASHAFHTRGRRPAGHEEWQEFDRDVLGGNYHGHHPAGPKTRIAIAPGAAEHPILTDIAVDSLVGNGSLYQVRPLAKTAVPILIGSIANQPDEPVAWTHTYRSSRIFYTSLGHPQDFENPHFVRLLTNATFWALQKNQLVHSAPFPGSFSRDLFCTVRAQ